MLSKNPGFDYNRWSASLLPTRCHSFDPSPWSPPSVSCSPIRNLRRTCFIYKSSGTPISFFICLLVNLLLCLVAEVRHGFGLFKVYLDSCCARRCRCERIIWIRSFLVRVVLVFSCGLRWFRWYLIFCMPIRKFVVLLSMVCCGLWNSCCNAWVVGIVHRVLGVMGWVLWWSTLMRWSKNIVRFCIQVL